MIRVTCDACGASFNARDELAGRKGKCPKCKQPIVVPAAGAGQSPVPVAPAPAAASSRAAGRRSAGGGRRRPARKSGNGLGVIVVVVVGLGLAAAAFKLTTGEDPGAQAWTRGLDAVEDANYEEAIAAFESIPAESQFHPGAQQKLTDARDLLAARDALERRQGSQKLADVIDAVERSYVLGPGPSDPDYAPNARYLLKRAAEFVARYPDHPKSATYRQFPHKYAKVASLDRPPTEADVMAELRQRCILVAPNFQAGGLAVDEFERSSHSDPDAVRRLRDWLQEQSLEWWKREKERLESQGYLTPGQESWQQVANACARYLGAIEGVTGITPSMEAQALLQRAERGG